MTLEAWDPPDADAIAAEAAKGAQPAASTGEAGSAGGSAPIVTDREGFKRWQQDMVDYAKLSGKPGKEKPTGGR